MAEFKFSCPQCDQHIQCDVGYAGMQINCPSCKQAIIVPQAPRSAAAPPAPSTPPLRSSAAAPPALATRQTTSAPAVGQRFAGALGAQPAGKPKSKAMKNILVITAVLLVLAVLGAGGWFGYSKLKAKREAKGNPAAQVAAPTSSSTVQALSILTKVYAAYTNLTSVSAEDTVTLSLNLSNLTVADINPGAPADAKNAKRRPPGMPRMVASTIELAIKRSGTNLYYFAGDAASKIDRQNVTNTFAFWKSDKGQFMFMDVHQKRVPPTYQQLPDANPANDQAEQIKKMQQLFADPANLTKIIKDLGQTDDEPANGQDCYTLTAKVLGQKVKIWVDKSTYLIPQWQITLGGQISDADIDDAFSLFATGFTNMPPMQLDMIKTQVKKMTPMMAKISGTLTSTCTSMAVNPALTADDFGYPVPEGVRLVRMPAMPATATTRRTSAASQRDACINNLRQIDAAKNEFALEKGKKNGDPVTEADITPYLAGGKLPVCPSGGTYTIGKVGENPTCSVPGHVLP